MTLNISLGTRTVDAYVAHVEDVLALALRQGTATLIEPRNVRPDARRVLAGMVELLSGFALGTIAGGVLGGTRTWLGDDVARELLVRFRPIRVGDAPQLSVPYVTDADRRPLVNHFGSRLHVRFCRMRGDVVTLLATLDELVARTAPGKRDLIEVVLDLLSRQDDIRARVAAEIPFAWATFGATMAGKPLPSAAGRTERSKKLWSAWRGCSDEDAPCARDETQPAGYILRVA